MRDNDQRALNVQQFCVLDDAGRNASADLGTGLAIAAGTNIGAVTPGFPEGSVSTGDVIIATAFPRTTMGFAQPGVGDDVLPQSLGKRLSRSQRPLQIRGHDARRCELTKRLCGDLSLAQPEFVELNVGVALESPVGVPARLPVTQQHHSQSRQSYSPCFCAAGVGGVTTRVGQSFQSRSRA